MVVEWSSTVLSRARVYAALGEPARLAIVDRLQFGDVSPSELGRDLAVPGNLLAHHVNLLVQAGVIERSRSEGDHRRTYLRLRTPMVESHPTPTRGAARVVFVCTDNAVRSPLAAALWARHSPIPAVSAGTHPVRSVHALAQATARKHGLSLGRTRPSSVADVLRGDDLVVAVCDRAHEHLPATERLHWSVPDPTLADSRAAFERAFQDLADRITRLAPAVHRQEPTETTSS